MTTLAQALAAAVSKHVEHTFGLMGNGNAHFMDALAKLGVPFSEVRHEVATVASADAYARVSGKLAVATATYGAGFTNTLTALAEAAQARTPLLLVVGDAPSSGLRPWDVDQEMAAAALGVRTFTVNVHNVERMVERAVKKATQQRMPVILAIPYDLVNAEVSASQEADAADINFNDPSTLRDLARATADTPARSALPVPFAVEVPAKSEIERAAETLVNAERPLILAGRGAWLSGAGSSLGNLSNELGAVTASTALARGIFEDQSFDLGLTGGFGQEAAMEVITQADAVLVAGASLNQFTMRFGDLFGAETKVVRIDLDQVNPPKTAHEVAYQLLRGDATTVVDALLDAVRNLKTTPSTWRSSLAGFEPTGALRVRETGPEDGICDDGRLDPRAVAARLANLLPEDRHVTSDGGHFIGWANMYWPVASPERMVMVGTAYQSIGLGFSTVAGIAAAAPDSTVVVTTGDGGGLMAIADLETTIRTTQSCVIVVWNDAAYGAEVHVYGRMGLDQEPMRIPNVNFAAVASALGATGVEVHTLSDLGRLTEWREAGANGTILLDCRVSNTVVAPYQKEIQRVNGIDTDEA